MSLLLSLLLITSCNVQESPKPWTPPPTTLSAEFIDATRFLLDHGLADPRGGEYREATITTRDTWQAASQKTKVNGWVLADGQVVTWNGLAYKADEIGDPVDLAADLAKKAHPREFGFRETVIRPGGPLAAALLLIAGKPDLAESSLKQPPSKEKGQLFSTMANNYLVARFHRAVHAHMAGDDKQAYEDAKALAQVAPAFEAEALRLFGAEEVNRRFESSLQKPGERKVFVFLNPIPQLLEESKRRLSTPKSKADLKQIATLTQPERIRRLIDALDEIAARQMSQPGGVSVAIDPIAAALANEGEAAVDPLLDVIENDKRLTRSVSFGRDFAYPRNLISVSSAATQIVSNILQLSTTGQSAAELRAFWNENRGRSRAERLFVILSDDSATPQRWLEAADQLVQPNDIRTQGGWVTMPTRKPGEPLPPMVGEELRKESGPLVSQLMAKRALQLSGSGEIRSSMDLFHSAEALRLGVDLAKWDIEAAKAIAPKLLERAIEMTSDPDMGGSGDFIYPAAGKFVAGLVHAGDRSAWTLYGRLISRAEAAGFIDASLFQPLWVAPHAPESRRIAQRIFLTQSPFIKSSRKSGSLGLLQNITSPWLKIPAFRQLLIKLLDDNTVVGKVFRDENGIRFTGNDGSSGGWGIDRSKDSDSKVGDANTYRVSDQIATKVTLLKGAPAYNPVWKDAKRNAALKSLQKYLVSIAGKEDQVLPDFARHRYPDW